MEMTITDAAAQLYIEEMDLQKNDSLRLFVRVGGCGSGGFSVGVTKETPQSSSYLLEKKGVNFFVNEEDFWYMDGMTIDYNNDLSYLTFDNPKIEDVVNPK
ncbi:HesB/YadR/YfhF family protein [Anaerobacillus sp. MEB173]|uniref:HesB/YadR/YfhF family protein n=1 Tax=Anaerobacillus sp. MEB173 TaxID=3383345 RepID=UPI003F903E7D